MYKKSLLQPILLGLITLIFAASCDKDFNELGTEIVGDDHYGFEKYTDASIHAYNQKLGAIASNNLAVNPLGIYDNPAFGKTTANFVTQVELSTLNPIFNNRDLENYDILPSIDSVVMDIPYFAHIPKNSTITDNVKPYVLDSIYGNPADKFKLSIYENKYFLRDFDPNQSLSESQLFYSDEDGTIDGQKGALLAEKNDFYFDKREHKTSVLGDDGQPDYTRSVPSMRLHLDKTVFNNAVVNAPAAKLANNTVFRNYFRGLYFKVEGATGHMATMNFKAGKITIFYEESKKLTSGANPTFDRVKKSYVLNLTGNTISLLNNSNPNVDYLNAANSTSEASKLYLKGGEGSVGMIDLFGDPSDSNYDTYGYVRKELSGVPVDIQGKPIDLNANGEPLNANSYFIYERVNSPNGIADELDELRYPPHLSLTDDPGQIYRSKKNRWMINEANLVFNIVGADDASGLMQRPEVIEPNRIYVYDMTHKKPIFDYTYDGTTNSLFPKFNKSIFGGILLDKDGKRLKQKDDATNAFVKKGSKYKIRITNHIRNLIKNDSTNVRIGVSVTENINNVAFSKLRTPNAHFTSAPSMSVMNPLGTILYGTGSSAPADKKLKLEIYYTKPKND